MRKFQMRVGVGISGVLLLAVGSDLAQQYKPKGEMETPAKWSLIKAAKQQVETTTAGTHTYEIEMGGTLDEFNTAGHLDTYGGSKRMESKFQPSSYRRS